MTDQELIEKVKDEIVVHVTHFGEGPFPNDLKDLIQLTEKYQAAIHTAIQELSKSDDPVAQDVKARLQGVLGR